MTQFPDDLQTEKILRGIDSFQHALHREFKDGSDWISVYAALKLFTEMSRNALCVKVPNISIEKLDTWCYEWAEAIAQKKRLDK